MIDDADDLIELRDDAASEMESILAEQRDDDDSDASLDNLLAGSLMEIGND